MIPFVCNTQHRQIHGDTSITQFQGLEGKGRRAVTANGYGVPFQGGHGTMLTLDSNDGGLSLCVNILKTMELHM
jgi:hypothetical protein